MSARRAQLVLLCEDSQQERFLRGLLEKRGYCARRIRVLKAPRGRGSGERFVREQFPDELQELRRGHVDRALIAMLDGDRLGPARRKAQLDGAYRDRGLEPRSKAERAAVFVPTWSIETWLAYLDGVTVDESRPDYPKLQRARDCGRHVDALLDMCSAGRLREPAPPSLRDACREFQEHLEPERS